MRKMSFGIFTFLFACLLFAVSLPFSDCKAEGASAQIIPEDAVEYNGHAYSVFHNEDMSWDEAQQYCLSMGGHLATISDKNENAFIYQYITSRDIRSAYFGLSDPHSDNNWQWVTGEPVDYTNWNEGEPNSDLENYGMFYYGFSDDKWNDGNVEGTVETQRNFICEWDQPLVHPSGTVPEVSPPAENEMQAPAASTPAPLPAVPVGEIVQFGHYDQDGDKKNGKEPIEWYVLDSDEQGVLLISLYSLESKPYSNKNVATNWKKSQIRTWLNKDFYNSAFSAQEKRNIISSHVPPAQDISSDSESILDQGPETVDKVLLLSRDEIYDKYGDVFVAGKMGIGKDNNGKIPFYAPKTAWAARDDINNYEAYDWWLRGEVYDKQDDYPYSAIACGSDGPSSSIPVTGNDVGVRPVIRINSLDSVSQNPEPSPLSYYPTPTPTAAYFHSALSTITESDTGSIVEFGSYEQDNDQKNGKEPVEWVILDVQDNKALLLSRYGLDAQPFNTVNADITWDKGSLRTWLNEDFFNSAFDDQERACILESVIDNGPLQGTQNGHEDLSVKGGISTKEKVFLLSVKEALVDYKVIVQLNPCEPTEFAKAQGVYTSNGGCYWKLRTVYASTNGLEFAEDYNGELFTHFSSSADEMSGAIRPAIWIDLSLVK